MANEFLINRRTLMAGAGALAGFSLTPAHAQARKVLILASGQDIPNFDPHVTTGYTPVFMMRNVYDSLVRIEGNPPKPVPHLAQSWTVSPDGMEYVFKLNPKAKFHDGTPVDADAVKYNFDRILRLKKGNSWMVSGVLGPDSVKVVDKETVKITLTKPFVAFLQVLVWQWIASPKAIEANKGSDDAQGWLRANIAGSGAFRLKRAEAGSLYELERVADAWNPGAGNLSGAIMRIVRETSSQRLMVQRGEAHVALDLTTEDIDALKGIREEGDDVVIGALTTHTEVATNALVEEHAPDSGRPAMQPGPNISSIHALASRREVNWPPVRRVSRCSSVECFPQGRERWPEYGERRYTGLQLQIINRVF